MLLHSYSDICKIILAIILPPLGVLLERGCGADLLINILLTILGKLPGPSGQSLALAFASPASHNKLTPNPGYIPGIIHALYIILKY